MGVGTSPTTLLYHAAARCQIARAAALYSLLCSAAHCPTLPLLCLCPAQPGLAQPGDATPRCCLAVLCHTQPRPCPAPQRYTPQRHTPQRYATALQCVALRCVAVAVPCRAWRCQAELRCCLAVLPHALLCRASLLPRSTSRCRASLLPGRAVPSTALLCFAVAGPCLAALRNAVALLCTAKRGTAPPGSAFAAYCRATLLLLYLIHEAAHPARAPAAKTEQRPVVQPLTQQRLGYLP